MLGLFLIVPMMYSQEKTSNPEQYISLTKEEAKNWLKSITMDELLDFIIKYDEVEHAKPIFGTFDYTCVITGQSVYVIPVNPVTGLQIASLKYQIQLPTMQFKGVIPKQESNFLRDFGIGFSTGVLTLSIVEIIIFLLK